MTECLEHVDVSGCGGRDIQAYCLNLSASAFALKFSVSCHIATGMAVVGRLTVCHVHSCEV